MIMEDEEWNPKHSLQLDSCIILYVISLLVLHNFQ